MQSKNFKRIAACGGAACVALGAFTVLHIGLMAEAAVAMIAMPLVGGGIWKFWPSAVDSTLQDIKTAVQNSGNLTGDATNYNLVVETASKASNKLDAIESASTTIRAPNTIRQIKKLTAVGRKIVDDIKQDPKDIMLVQSWANSYLDETLNLVKGYATLSQQGTTNIEAQRQMAKFDEMLDTLEKQFNDLLKRCVENDVLDFDITMSVMDNRLKQEGM